MADGCLERGGGREDGLRYECLGTKNEELGEELGKELSGR